jgi:transcriptional regulator with XRE-family HTH domain
MGSPASPPSWHLDPWSLDLRLMALRIDARGWEVLESRVGLGESLTLQEIAGLAGVSRARIGQIDLGSRNKLAKHLGIIAPAFDSIERWNLGAPDQAGQSQDEALLPVRSALIRDGWHSVTSNSVLRLVLILRALIDRGHTWITVRWPQISFYACRLSPAIRAHPEVNIEIQREESEERDRNRIWSYGELAEAVLDKHGAPLHWRDMADRAEKLGHRSSFSQQGFLQLADALQAPHADWARHLCSCAMGPHARRSVSEHHR